MTTRYYKRDADSDFGSGVCYFEIVDGWIARQVENYGEIWRWGDDNHQDYLGDLPESELGIEDATPILANEFEVAWRQAQQSYRPDQPEASPTNEAATPGGAGRRWRGVWRPGRKFRAQPFVVVGFFVYVLYLMLPSLSARYRAGSNCWSLHGQAIWVEADVDSYMICWGRSVGTLDRALRSGYELPPSQDFEMRVGTDGSYWLVHRADVDAAWIAFSKDHVQRWSSHPTTPSPPTDVGPDLGSRVPPMGWWQLRP